MAIRIEKGIVAFKKDGTIIVFPDGNVGKDNEYLRFNKTSESKELARLFSSPKYLFEQLGDADKEAGDLEKLIAWINELGYYEGCPDEINRILNDE